MQGIENPSETGALDKIVQTGEGRMAFPAKEVPICDENHIPFRKTVLRIKILFLVDQFLGFMGIVHPENSFKLRHIFFCLGFPIKETEPPQHPLLCLRWDFQERPGIIRF
jgi:hypothetical protein